MAILLGYLIYALGTNTFSFSRAGAITALVFVPLALAASAERASGWSLAGYVTIAGVWVAVKFSPSHWLWPWPGGRLAYVFTVVFCVNVALATFLLLRRLPGIGYSIGWGQRWGLYVSSSFGLFAAIAIPLGTVIHFVQFAPRWAEWKSLPFLTLAILCFTAWPEEFLFRELRQNLLARSTKSEMAGWWTASVLFGFSHITNGGFPNWRYVILASIAGLFLWVDLAQDRVDFRFGDRTCTGGWALALLVSDFVRWMPRWLKPKPLREVCAPTLVTSVLSFFPFPPRISDNSASQDYRAFFRVPRPSFEYSFSKYSLTSDNYYDTLCRVTPIPPAANFLKK